MNGKRVYPDDEGDLILSEGDYGFDPKSGIWFAKAPGCHIGNLVHHQVTEHADGTISVTPSILISQGDGKGGFVQVWHGYLEHGVWREV
jgi:hypothetical protein